MAKDAGINKSELLKSVVHYYTQRFPENRAGLDYLASKGIVGDELYRTFQVGFADSTLLNTLPQESTNELVEVLKELGVLTKDGKEYLDNCVTFPVFDINDSVSAIYGINIQTSKTLSLLIPGTRSKTLNWKRLKTHKDVILTNSILDTLSCIILGKQNAIPLLEEGFPHSLVKLLSHYRTEKIFSMIPDKVRRFEIKEAVSSLGIDVIEVELPKVVNTLLLENFTSTNLEQAIKQAEEKFAASLEPTVTRKDECVFVDFVKREYRVKGLVAENLEKMKVNIKIQQGDFYHLDTVDLYSSKARATFISHARRTIEATERELSKEINRVILELEKIQTESLDIKVKEDKDKLSDEEKTEVLDFLRSPTLLSDILLDMEELGVIGETSNKAIAYLVGISRKLSEPLSCAVISQSGVGKSVIAETLERLTPAEEVLLFSRLSPQAIYYMGKDDLKDKLLILEEKTGNGDLDFSIKSLQTRKKLTTAIPVRDPDTGQVKTKRFTIYGSLAYVEVTSKPKVNEESASRSFELYLDTSEKQTREIHKFQKDMKSINGLTLEEKQAKIIRKHHNTQKMLKEIKVVNPFVHLIQFPSTWIKTRRSHLQFLNLVEVITHLHQYQRTIKKTPDNVEYIESTLEDYRIAYDLAKDVLCEGFRELKKPERDLLSAIEHIAVEEKEMTRKLIRDKTGLPDYQLRKLLEGLVSLEYVIALEGKQGKTFRYKLAESAPQKKEVITGLTSPDELAKKIKPDLEVL